MIEMWNMKILTTGTLFMISVEVFKLSGIVNNIYTQDKMVFEKY